MSFKTILASIEMKSVEDGSLESALKLGRQFDARIEALWVSQVPTAHESDSQTHQRIADLCTQYHYILTEGPEPAPLGSVHFSIIKGDRSEEVSTHGRVADLIVTRLPQLNEESAGSRYVEFDPEGTHYVEVAL